MKKILYIFIFFYLPSVAAFANIPESNITCYDCSPYDYRSTALREAYRLRAMDSIINVIDLSNSSVTTFRYQSYAYDDEIGDIEGPGVESITQIRSSSTIVQSTHRAASFVASNAFQWPTGREGITDSTGIVRHAQKDRILDDWMHEENKLHYYFLNLLSLFGGTPFDILRGIPLRVEFEDGSIIYIKSFDFNSSDTFTMKYKEGSARDADGNEVPTSQSEYLRTFLLTEGNIDSWVNNAQDYGVIVERHYTATGIPSRSLRTSCEQISNGRFKCTIISSNNEYEGPQ